MRPVSLEDYPLAKAYGWKDDQETTGGILYIYPPLASYVKTQGGERVTVHPLKDRKRLEAINPEYLTGAAQRVASVRYYKSRSHGKQRSENQRS